MEDGSGQSSERLTRRSDPGLTFQGSIRVKQVKRERMGIPGLGFPSQTEVHIPSLSYCRCLLLADPSWKPEVEGPEG